MSLQRRLFRPILRICLSASLLLWIESASATTASTKAMGMGGCAIAYPQDAMALAWNPATGVYIGNRFDVNAAWLQTRGEAIIYDNLTLGDPPSSVGFKSNVHPNVFDAEFGVNNIVCGSYDVALGLVGYNKTYIQTHYSDPIPLFGDTKLGMEIIQEVIAPTLSIRLDCHSFGVSIQLAGERFKVDGVENFASDLFTRKPGKVTNRGHDYAYGIGIVAGWLWRMYPGVRMGFVYESRTYMSKLKKYQGFVPDHSRIHLPERFALGFGFDFTCNFHAAIDLHLVRWSETALGSRTLLGALAPPSTGTSGSCGKLRGFGFGWRDQPFIRAGVDYHLDCINTVFRAGYRWARTPIRSVDTAANILTLEAAESVISVGATVRPWTHHEISVAYDYGFNHTVRGSRRRSISPFFGGGYADLKNGLQFAKIGYGVSF